MTEELTPLGAALRDALDGRRWAWLRRQIRSELDVPRLLPDPGLSMEQHRAWVSDHLRDLAATPHPKYSFPERYGGSGDLGASAVSFEMLGHADLSLLIKCGVQWGLFGGAVYNLGTRAHHEEYLTRIVSGELPGCFAMTEVDHGSDVQHLETTATYDECSGEFVLHTPGAGARKTYIGGAACDARMAVVFAQLETRGEQHGVHALLVPVRDEQGAVLAGVEVADNGVKAGLNGVDNGTLAFDHVRVPRKGLLSHYGDVAADGTYSSPIENPDRRFFTMLGALVRGRISIGGAAGSATRTALSIAVRYGLQRRQFTRPADRAEVVLLDYLTHQRTLLPRVATSYALAFAQDRLVGRLHDVQSTEKRDQRLQRELETRAAGLKAVATWHATQTIQACREACGGAGYMAGSRLPTLRADTDVFTTFEGDNTVLLQLVAKGLLTHYRAMWGDLDTLGMVQFAARQFGGTAIERTAARGLVQRLVDAVPGRDDDLPLLDRGWHLRLFEDRERHLLDTLAQRMRAGAEPGADAWQVFNQAQDHVLHAARAHVDRVVLEAFVDGIAECPDPRAQEVLSRLCDLHVMANLEADKGWLLQHDRLSPGRAKAVTAQVNQLCEQLRPDALALVEGFGIPRAWLCSSLVPDP
ncbi:MAG TPA: acyl-CoA dehydrogenase [Segeticoccus sp.]|uniref:acyl-CoA dehydrogenase family protein n=1 Tax=Segeticoccus sp. TaxID=2706531 RepID=UPI002D7F812E|nr:acyl-CoA dehydrogenase [Segeticoccus sp.]HET8599754.1 acyl-CoA dehydrogenase [Segeticoccus sp.]